MASKEDIHTFSEQMFNDYLFVPSTRNKAVNEQSACFHETYNQMYQVKGRKKETVNIEHQFNTSVDNKCQKEKVQEPEAEYGCDFIGVVRDILSDIIFQQNSVKDCVMVNCVHQPDCGIQGAQMFGQTSFWVFW